MLRPCFGRTVAPEADAGVHGQALRRCSRACCGLQQSRRDGARWRNAAAAAAALKQRHIFFFNLAEAGSQSALFRVRKAFKWEPVKRTVPFIWLQHPGRHIRGQAAVQQFIDCRQQGQGCGIIHAGLALCKGAAQRHQVMDETNNGMAVGNGVMNEKNNIAERGTFKQHGAPEEIAFKIPQRFSLAKALPHPVVGHRRHPQRNLLSRNVRRRHDKCRPAPLLAEPGPQQRMPALQQGQGLRKQTAGQPAFDAHDLQNHAGAAVLFVKCFLNRLPVPECAGLRHADFPLKNSRTGLLPARESTAPDCCGPQVFVPSVSRIFLNRSLCSR